MPNEIKKFQSQFALRDIKKDEAAAKNVVSVCNALNLQIVRNKAKNPKYHNV